jgi:hypothetical protein
MAAAHRTLFSVLVAGVMHAVLAPGAASQSQARVGDLVEVTSGLGPTLAEVVTGPDPSGYVVIRVPTGKEMPVNTQKLRLVQPAGTPNASMPVGEAVSWVDGNVREKGSVVKVNGKWCQVKTADATTVGWVECAELRRPGAAAKASSPASSSAGAGSAPLPKLLGNWENADGSVKLEFQSAGKCYISFGPMTGPCSYTPAATGVTVTFEGEPLRLVANPDGSLSSVNDGDGMMSMRLKRR